MALAALVILYTAVYILLSSIGEYRIVKAKPRDFNVGPSDAALDVQIWWPVAAVFQNDYALDGQHRQTRSNLLGLIFSPLITLDRRFIHRSVLIVEGIDPSMTLEPR
jgi:hypothetical protein